MIRPIPAEKEKLSTTMHRNTKSEVWEIPIHKMRVAIFSMKSESQRSRRECSESDQSCVRWCVRGRSMIAKTKKRANLGHSERRHNNFFLDWFIVLNWIIVPFGQTLPRRVEPRQENFLIQACLKPFPSYANSEWTSGEDPASGGGAQKDLRKKENGEWCSIERARTSPGCGE